jgi:hypothetical protein
MRILSSHIRPPESAFDVEMDGGHTPLSPEKEKYLVFG